MGPKKKKKGQQKQRDPEYEQILTVPPDGGYGWVIVFFCYYGYTIIDVPALGFGPMAPYLAEELGKPKSLVAAIVSTYILLMFFAGPLAAGVCNRFGFGITLFIGGLLGVIGKAICYFIQDYVLYILFNGLISGIGAAFIFMVCSIAPGFWFEEKRAIVMGIVSSATGVGCFTIMATEFVMGLWGWKSAFLFWAVLFFIQLVVSFLVRSPPTVEISPLEVSPSEMAAGTSRLSLAGRDYSVLDRKLLEMSAQAGMPLRRALSYPSRYYTEPLPEQNFKTKCYNLCCFCCKQSDAVGSRPLYRSDIFYHGQKSYVAQRENIDPDTYTLSVTRLPTVRDVKQEVECHCAIPESVKRPIRDMIDIKLFKSGIFLLFVSSALFHYTSLYIPVLTLNKLNGEFMDPEYANLMVPFIGVGTFISRLTIGFLLILIPKLGALTLIVVGTFLGGVVTCMFSLSQNMYFQYSMAFLSGLFIGVFVPLRTVIIIDLLGLDKLTSVTGTLFFFQGFGSFIGFPASEWLVEVTDNEYMGLYFSGVTMIMNSFSLFLVGVIHKIYKK